MINQFYFKRYSGKIAILIAGASLACTAHAASDLKVQIQGPLVLNVSDSLIPFVYTTRTYKISVSNASNKNFSNNVRLKVTLPKTGTSPQVYILGQLGLSDNRCSVMNNDIFCNLSILKKNSTDIFYTFNLPYATKLLSFAAEVNTIDNRNNASFTLTPTLDYPNLPIVGDVNAINYHCTGTVSLSSYFECQLFSSSISQHNTILKADHTISIPTDPDYSGTWQQPGSDKNLSFEYTLNGTVVGSFTGKAVSNNINEKCFEGKMIFPTNATYISMYKVCFQ